MTSNPLLADIGNTHFHLYNGTSVEHLSYEEALAKYSHTPLYYISVKSQLSSRIDSLPHWVNISDSLFLNGAYDTMGIDRKALCLSRPNGIFVDAGSAITVDIVQENHYQGGFILLGLLASVRAYRAISPALEITLDREIKIEETPKGTQEGISYGIIASIISLIAQQQTAYPTLPLYFTGGDGAFLSSFFEEALYDERLVFEGMRGSFNIKWYNRV